MPMDSDELQEILGNKILKIKLLFWLFNKWPLYTITDPIVKYAKPKPNLDKAKSAVTTAFNAYTTKYKTQAFAPTEKK